MPETIGFIGLGIMGQPMALNLAKAGHKLAVYNRTPGKTAALEAAGARVAASPADAVRDASIVMHHCQRLGGGGKCGNGQGRHPGERCAPGRSSSIPAPSVRPSAARWPVTPPAREQVGWTPR